MDGRHAQRVVRREAEDPLHARGGRPSRRRRDPRRNAGIAWANAPSGVGWTPILGGSSAPDARPRSVSSASRRRSGSDGMAAGHVGAGQVAQGREVGHGPSLGQPGPVAAGSPGRSSLDCPREHRPGPREPQAGAGRGRPVRPAGRDREGPAAGRRLPPHRGQRAPPRGHLGRPPARARRDRPAARPAARAGPLHHRRRPPVRDACRVRPRQGARGRRGGDLRRPGRPPRHRGDRRRRARARGDLAPARRRRRRGQRRSARRRDGRPPRSSRRASTRPSPRAASRAAARRSRRPRAGTGAPARGPCARSSSASRTASCRTCPS